PPPLHDALPILVLATGGGDLAAQDAWAGFVTRHGSSAYNLFWYGGMHTANYSLVSPYLMAGLGVRTVTVLAGVAGSWLAAVLVVRDRKSTRLNSSHVKRSDAVVCLKKKRTRRCGAG